MTPSIRRFSIVVFLCCWLAPEGLILANSLPGSREEEIVRKVAARAHWAREKRFQNEYSFHKKIHTQEFDERGTVVGGEKKEFDVPAQPGKVPKKEKFEINEEMIQRFTFTLTGREQIAGRSTLVLSFMPRPGPLPIRRLTDRLVNRAIGTLWVDEESFELARADIQLSEPVRLAGGALGVVHAFTYQLVRVEVEKDVWLVARSEFYLKARQLLSNVHRRKSEQWSGFRRTSG
jgi:hypothetical protein